MSTGVEAMKMPESPPMMNMETNPRACSIGVWRWMSPFQIVPSQLKTLIADGTAITMVVTMKVVPSIGFIPLWNMWWPHTIQLRKAMDTMASTNRVIAENRLA